MILCIETATDVCSAALCNDTMVTDSETAPQGMSHASQLTVIIGRLLERNHISAADLAAVAVSKGPGSYTGLRIGVSVAKGIAYGAGTALLGIDTLEAMCSGFIALNPGVADTTVLLCPMIDARRMEVYNAIFTAGGVKVKETAATVIEASSFRDVLDKQEMIFFGNGSEKCSTLITHPNARFIPGFRLSASYLHKPSVNALRNKLFEDVAYFEPYYLKEFIATTPRKLLP